MTKLKIEDLLEYKEGIIYWKESPSKYLPLKGRQAGTLCRRGYRHITIGGKSYLAHRVAWLLYYKKFPKNHLDHINGIRDDNRIDNLREVTSRQNNINYKCHREGKLPGTSYDLRSNKWYARYWKDSKSFYLGCFQTEYLAYEAYKKALEFLL